MLRTRNILQHMLEDIDDIIAFTQDMTLEDFIIDSKTRKAVSMSLINIGELAKLLHDHIKSKHPQIPWKSIIGMRNMTAHGYHQLNAETLWETVQIDMAPLRACIADEIAGLDK